MGPCSGYCILALHELLAREGARQQQAAEPQEVLCCSSSPLPAPLQLDEMYPNMPMKFRLSAPSAPFLNIGTNGVSLQPVVDIQAYAIYPNGNLAPLFLLGLVSWGPGLRWGHWARLGSPSHSPSLTWCPVRHHCLHLGEQRWELPSCAAPSHRVWQSCAIHAVLLLRAASCNQPGRAHGVTPAEIPELTNAGFHTGCERGPDGRAVWLPLGCSEPPAPVLGGAGGALPELCLFPQTGNVSATTNVQSGRMVGSLAVDR